MIKALKKLFAKKTLTVASTASEKFSIETTSTMAGNLITQVGNLSGRDIVYTVNGQRVSYVVQ